MRALARRSIVTACLIEKNKVVEKLHLTAKRPGTGISPMEINKIIGKRVKKTLPPDTIIKLSDLK